MENPFKVLLLVTSVLEQQKIIYLLVGSVASSIHGMYRASADIDIVADIKSTQVVAFIDALRQNFYIDEQVVREAVDRKQSFNAIHFDSVFKVDIFVPQSDDFSRKQIERRELRKLSPDFEQMIYVATAEDTILAKLRWYHAGGRVSSNQWADVIGILGASAKRLEFDYLHLWAGRLGLTDLLDRAFREAMDDDSNLN